MHLFHSLHSGLWDSDEIEWSWRRTLLDCRAWKTWMSLLWGQVRQV